MPADQRLAAEIGIGRKVVFGLDINQEVAVFQRGAEAVGEMNRQGFGLVHLFVIDDDAVEGIVFGVAERKRGLEACVIEGLFPVSRLIDAKGHRHHDVGEGGLDFFMNAIGFDDHRFGDARSYDKEDVGSVFAGQKGFRVQFAQDFGRFAHDLVAHIAPVGANDHAETDEVEREHGDGEFGMATYVFGIEKADAGIPGEIGHLVDIELVVKAFPIDHHADRVGRIVGEEEIHVVACKAGIGQDEDPA